MNRNHAPSKAPRHSLIALLCLAAAGGVFAQEDAPRTRAQAPETAPPVERVPGVSGADTGVMPAPIGPVKPVRLGCCRCLGETLGPINISTGQPVPWTVNNSPTVPLPMVGGWHGWNNAPPVPPGSQWVGPVNGNAAAPGTYTYRLNINVPKCVIPGSVTISGKFWADNKGTVSLTSPPPSSSPATFSTLTNTSPMHGFLTSNGQGFSYTVAAPGTYTLTVTTTNESGPTGMLMDARVIKRCTTEALNPDGVGNSANSASSPT